MKPLLGVLSILTVLALPTAAVTAVERDVESAAEARLPSVRAASDHLAGLSQERRQRGGDLNWVGHGWGIAYLVPNLITSSRQAWFTWSPAIRYSGFESGNTSEWNSAVQ